MATFDLIPAKLRPAKQVGGKGDSSPRVSGVSDEAVTPVPDAIAGHVLPYRGTELHGVPDDGQPYVDPRDELRKSVDVGPLVELHPPTPVLVKVVEDDGAEVKAWRVISAYVDGTPRLILNRMPNRSRANIANKDEGNIVWLGPDSTVSPLNGFSCVHQSGINVGVELTSTEEVWAVSDTGSVQELRILIEYTRG